MIKRWILFLCCVAWVMLLFCTALSVQQQRGLAEKTIRLHVVANSDSNKDQTQKLRVRDAVLLRVEALTATCSTADEAFHALEQALPALQTAACDTLRAEGCNAAVQVTLTQESFATRRYDTFTLPAGVYPTLRVSIGHAKGRNWWCVVFPSLCTAATSEAMAQSAQVAGYEEDELELITGGETRYIFRFKTLEWLRALGALLH